MQPQHPLAAITPTLDGDVLIVPARAGAVTRDPILRSVLDDALTISRAPAWLRRTVARTRGRATAALLEAARAA